MANFALNYSFSRNLNLPLDEDAVKALRSDVVTYVQTKSKCYAGQLFSVTGDTAENNGLYIAVTTGEDALIVKLASQDALDAVAASAGKIDTIKLNGSALTINDKVVNIDLSSYATIDYVDGKISGLTEIYAPKAEFEAVQKKVEEITSVGGEPNVQSDWDVVDTGSDAFIKNKPDLTVYATKTELNEAQTAFSGLVEDNIEALADVYASKTLVDTLVGEDTEKSARAIAAEEVAKVVASADSSFDTLKEIADWIANDTTGSAQMAEDIAALKAVSADTRLASLETDTHKHENKDVLDGISSDKVTAWDAAEKNAKDYADAKETAIHTWVEDKKYLTEHQDISHLATKTEVSETEGRSSAYTDAEISKLSDVYDEKGAAASAKTDAVTEAKDYTDTEIGKLGNTYATTGAVDTIKTNLENKIANDIASAKTEAIEAASAYTDVEIAKLSKVYASKSAFETLVGEDTEKSARDIAAEEVAKIVASADSSFDTLKEIADYIANDITSAATLANTVSDLVAVNADSRLEALEAISGESHTHSNKALLDTYTQTEADLADAVDKKHEHTNKDVLDGISSAKVTAWDAAEQNAKDYADGLVENIKPYEGGVATSIVSGENDTYVVNVKVAEETENKKNFLDVSEANELEVTGITLDAAKTSKEIVVEGGAWESIVKPIFGTSVPAGTTWESFLEAMLCVEKFPGVISTTSAFTVSCGNINPGIDKSGTVEVGTLVTLNKTVANDTTATQSITVGTFSGAGKTYGYKIGENGAHVDAKTYTETLTPSLKSSSKALKVTFTGFTNAVNNGTVVETKTGEGEIAAVEMYAMSGTNKVKVYQTGDTYTSSSAVTAGTIYAATNLKNYYKSDKITPNTHTPSCPAVDNTASDTTEYSVTGAFKYFIGDVTEKDSGTYWDTDRSEIVRGLKTTGWTTANSITITHTFKIGTKQQTVVVPAKYTSVAGKDVNNGDVTFNLVKTFDFTNAQGYISSYKVFVAPSSDGLGSDSTITITIK